MSAPTSRPPPLPAVLRLPVAMGRRLPAVIVLAGLLASSSGVALAQEPTRIEGLGSLSFQNSGAAEAQDAFLRGVLLLHSFEYEPAAEAFREAQELDPDFALAYWGEAMTHNHPVWNEKDRDAALEALARYGTTPEARAARAPTSRERAYLAAVDVLYGEGDKATLDTLYSREMERLVEDHPGDLEARLFHALSLLGLSRGDRDVPTYMEAGAIALDAFEVNPDHPGAAHYAIHSFDDPAHAVLAMDAARAYAAIAPQAAHAQHMTTHIFLARGMWDEVVEANERADAVTDRGLAARGLPPADCFHYNEWLLYGYQQQGRFADAEALALACLEEARGGEAGRYGRSPVRSFALMRNLHLADTRRWHGPVAAAELDLEGQPEAVRLMHAWGSGVAAVHRGHRREAEERLAELRRPDAADDGGWLGPYLPVWRGTLEAWLLADAGDLDGAVRAARAAAEHEASLPVDFGPPLAFKPARELEGELLLEAGRAEEAVAAFRFALRRTPRRVQALAGYARAAAATGRTERAEEAYRELAAILEDADPGSRERMRAVQWLRDHAGASAAETPMSGRALLRRIRERDDRRSRESRGDRMRTEVRKRVEP